MEPSNSSQHLSGDIPESIYDLSVWVTERTNNPQEVDLVQNKIITSARQALNNYQSAQIKNPTDLIALRIIDNRFPLFELLPNELKYHPQTLFVDYSSNAENATMDEINKFIREGTPPYDEEEIDPQTEEMIKSLIGDYLIKGVLPELSKNFQVKEIMKVFKGMNITSPDEKFRVAKSCATTLLGANEVMENISMFEPFTPTQCFELAEICAKNSSISIKEFFEVFNITDPDESFKLAKIFAFKRGHETARFFHCFNIPKEEDRVILAKLCIKNGEAGQSIREFNIENPFSRIELLKFAFAQPIYVFDNYDPVCFIGNYDVLNKENYNEFIELAFKQSPPATLSGWRQLFGFPEFNLEEFKPVIKEWENKIAQVCVQENPDHLLRSLSNFFLLSPQEKTNLLKQAAQIHPREIPSILLLVKIFQPELMLDILKECAKKAPDVVAKKIRKYKKIAYSGRAENYFSALQRFELGKICARNEGSAILQYIDNFQLSQEQKEEIYTIAFRFHPIQASVAFSKVRDKLSEFFVKKMDPLRSKPLIEAALCGDHEAQRALVTLDSEDPLYWLISSFSNFHEKDIEIEIEKFTLNTPYEHEVRKLLTRRSKKTKVKVKLFLTALLLLAMRGNLSENEIKNCLENGGFATHIEEIASMQAPHLRPSLLRALIDGIKNRSLNLQNIKFPSCYPLTLLTQLNNLTQKGIDEGVVRDFIGKFNRDFLRDRTKVKILLKALIFLNESKANNPMLLRKIVEAVDNMASKNPKEQQKKLLSTLQSLIALFEFGTIGEVTEETTFEDVVNATFRKKLGIQELEDIAGSFQETFGKSRNPQAIITLAAKYSTLSEELLLSLGDFISSVLKGTFYEERYELSDKTLLTLEHNQPRIIAEWRILEDPVQMVFENGKNHLHPTPEQLRKWMKTVLINDRHLDMERFSRLYRNLTGNPLDSDSNEIPIASSSSASANVKKSYTDRFQDACIKLLDSSLKEDQDKCFRVITKLMVKMSLDETSFFEDLKIFTRKNKESAKDEWELVNSDDPDDLLLCGTEIPGSCQTVDGNPRNNCGLLGYIKKGNIQMMGVRNKKTKVFRSRALIKLLPTTGREGESTLQNKAAVFIERTYPGNVSEKDITAIINMAIKKAARVKAVPLLGKDEYQERIGEAFPGTLQSYKSLRAPFEYSDEHRGVTNGEYVIEKAYYVRGP